MPIFDLKSFNRAPAIEYSFCLLVFIADRVIGKRKVVHHQFGEPLFFSSFSILYNLNRNAICLQFGEYHRVPSVHNFSDHDGEVFVGRQIDKGLYQRRAHKAYR
jgi:hypothetical protein